MTTEITLILIFILLVIFTTKGRIWIYASSLYPGQVKLLNF